VTLSAGARLGPYEVISPLGAGGMGEVYRAKDTRLDRSVALKVLSDHLSGSEEVRQRFEREAKAISSLQHPNICTLHDVGREGEIDFLVMELLEGESLADRIEKGPLPIEEVLRLGIQIADALEKAHTAGIVHRDLKPGNVFLTDRGVKLLDFGLAKLHSTAPQSSRTQLGQLPTEAKSAPLTSAGMILGTFQYMAPEQLEGRESDARSDLFALGCVLYEMATGKKAFTGTSQASLIGSIMSGTPAPVSSLAPLSPPALDRVISTCLAKDPKDRWHTAHDVRLQLAWIAEGGSQLGLPAPVAHHRKNRERAAWALAALATVAAALFAAGYVRRAPVAAELVRFEVPQPPKLPVVGSPKLSPDGRYLAFDGTDDQGVTRIWVRAMNALEAQPLPGTEGTNRPFWSPDSRFLGFIAGGKLKKVEVTGGPPQTICDAPTGADGSWGEDGTILFDGANNDPIRKVSAGGGVATDLLGDQKNTVGWPQFLPGGKRFLYVDITEGKQGIRIADLDGKNVREVIGGQSRVEYAPPGYLLFVRDATLVAQRFDVGAGTLTGDPIPVAEGLGIDNVGLADFSVSRNGHLAYRVGRAGQAQFVWLDRKGNRGEPATEAGALANFDLSPDGRWLAYQVGTSADGDLWVRDLKRGVSSRFTFEKGGEGLPLFSRDSRSVLFQRSEEGKPARIVERALDRTGEEKVLFEAPGRAGPSAFTPDGRSLIFQRQLPDKPWQIWTLPIGQPAQAKAVVASEFYNGRPAVSPDGRWLAFESTESGAAEIYVVGIAGASGRWQISTRGGEEPAWGPDGRELFYVSPENRLMRVAVTTGSSFDAGVPEPLFGVTLARLNIRNRYRVAPDGQRFLVLTPQGDLANPPTTVLLNWTRLLER
jgi:eukaryotic-like serine/threonine-protein kinase